MLRLWVRIPPGGMDVSVVSVMFCQVEVSATDWSLVQWSPTDYGASLCVWSRNLVNEETLAHWGGANKRKNQSSLHQQMHPFIKHIKYQNVQLKYLYVCSYMFRSTWTILRELMLSLAKATILWNCFSLSASQPYMFQTVPPPIISSSKLYTQHRALSRPPCLLPLSWVSWNSPTTAARSRKISTNTRCHCGFVFTAL